MQVIVAGYSERGNDISGSLKGREFIDQLSDYQLLQKYSNPWK
jgi:hypothetical protein